MTDPIAYLAADLAALLGPDAVSHGDAVARLDPGWHPDNLRAGLVVSPTDCASIARLLAWCNDRGIGVVPQGGRTGLVGGAISHPGEVVLSLARMNRIERLDATGCVAIVEAGVTLAALQTAARAVGLDPGIDTAARDSATIGGMISTNAGGIRAFRHGVMRHRILGLEAVLADGTVMTDLTEVLKNTTGYDAKQIFIGAEGTLGVVTRAAIRLEPLAGPRATALIGLPDAASAVAAVARFRRMGGAELHAAEVMSGGFAKGSAIAHGLDPATLELGAPISLIIELSATSEAAAMQALETGLAEIDLVDGVIAQTLKQRDAIWLIREASEAMARLFGFALWEDVSIPPVRIDGWLVGLTNRIAAIDPALEIHFIGHLADGNLHVLIARPAPYTLPPKAEIEAALYDGLDSLGGAFAAEHGIGTEKLAALARFSTPGKQIAMRRLKMAFDPGGILNPGKIVPR